MRKAFVEQVALPEPRFRDGLGIRYVRTAGTDDPVEVLRPLWDVGSMQNAVRQRVSRLQSFRQARFITLRSAEIPRDDPSTIEVVSDFVAGYRLSQYLEAARAGVITIDTSAAVYMLRELLGALALLRESRGVTHGAVAPERILITSKGRLVVADYVLGPAIERLEYTRPRLWREFRVPVPAGKGHPKLDDKADVMQVGMTAMALLLGRPIEPTEFPDGVDNLVVTLGNAHRLRGLDPLPPALVGWVKRAVHKDAAGKFADVLDARLLLESVVSRQDVASGGAASLKSVAETFGCYAAGIEAKAAAAAAEEARLAALAAQAAAMDAIRLAAAESVTPGDNAVPAFTLLSEAPAGQAAGSVSEAIPDHAALPAAESDPPVGWRVPEAPTVEDTLPVSPLLQIDTPAAAADAGEFVEEVLDLSGLTDDEVVAEAAAAALPDESAPPPPTEPVTVISPAVSRDAAAYLASADVVDAVASVESADLAEPTPPTDPAACPEPMMVEADVAAEEVPAPPDVTAEPVADVDEVLAALQALEAATPPAPPAQDALPEWRLLADPIGAVAPTIDVVEPTEPLEALVAEFAATLPAPEAPADLLPVPAEEVTEAAEPPAAMLATGVPVLSVPTEFAAGAAETGAPVEAEPAPAEAEPAILEVVLGLQEAQAAAQAAVEEPPESAEGPPDIGAWSFVEELVHRDARFEARTPLVVEEPQVPGVAADPARREPQPVPDVEVPALPADWFIEVGRRRDQAAEPLPSRTTESLPDESALRHVETVEQTPPPTVAPAVIPAATVAARAVLPVSSSEATDTEPLQRLSSRWSPDQEADSDGSGPVFPRVAPSVRRVRAEARRRRWAKVASAVGDGLASTAGSLASGVGAAVSGVAALFGGLGRAGASAVHLMAAAVKAVGAGALAAVGAGVRGLGAAVRATAAGLAAVVGGVASGLTAVAGGIASGLTAAGRGAGAVLVRSGALFAAAARASTTGAAAFAKALAWASASMGRATVRVAAAAALGAAAGMRALAGAVGRGASAAGTGVASVSRALASGAGVLGRAGLAAGAVAARAMSRAVSMAGTAAATAGGAAVTVPRRVYFIFSDAADRLPKPAVRPWYLGAALLVIVAVAGVPYAKSWLSTHAPDLRARLVEPSRPAVEPSVPAETPKLPAAAAKGTGSVRVTVDPAGADVLLDGMLQGSAPLTIENLTAGLHTLVVRDDSGTVRRSVRVTADQATDVSLNIRPGWLAVFAPVKLEVLENGKPIGSTEAGRILAAPGPHTIELASRAIGFRETRQVEIKPGEVAAVTVQLPPATVEVAAPADAEIFVDGQSVGIAPLGPLQIAVGTRELVMRHPTLGERRQVVAITYNGPARVSFE